MIHWYILHQYWTMEIYFCNNYKQCGSADLQTRWSLCYERTYKSVEYLYFTSSYTTLILSCCVPDKSFGSWIYFQLNTTYKRKQLNVVILMKPNIIIVNFYKVQYHQNIIICYYCVLTVLTVTAFAFCYFFFNIW